MPSGLTNACTVTSRGMSCADSPRNGSARATTSNRAARRAALERHRLLGRVGPGQTTPWFGLVTGAHALVDEPLQAFSFLGLGRVEVALRVDRDAVHAVELAGLPAAVAEGRQLLQRLAIDDA